MSDDRKVVSIANILDDAELSFWSQVVKHLPLAESGDFPPDHNHSWQTAIEEAVITWWDCNASDQYDLMLMNGTILSREVD